MKAIPETVFDYTEKTQEGWALVQRSGTDLYEIQAWLDYEVFPVGDDKQAVDFVARKARGGSSIHSKALRFAADHGDELAQAALRKATGGSQ